MKNKVLILSCVILLLIVLLNMLILKAYRYECDGGKNIEARYKDKVVNLVLSDERKFTLNRTLSASGIRFANNDESIVFWSKGKSAFFQEKSKIIYSNCVENNSQ